MRYCLLIISLSLFMLFSCNKKVDEKPFVLISKDSNSNIEHWLKGIDPNISTREFYTISKDSMQYFLKRANGIVLGGGEDVNPTLYNKPEYDSICEAPDNFRDSIEFLMIDYAMKTKMPILGICRGLQILNIANGGTLIPDIPSFIRSSTILHRFENDSAHCIIPLINSWLEQNFTYTTIWVNSHHHQSIDQIAPNFIISAYAPDSVIESIEIKDTSIHPFAIGIQWHPETLHDSLSKEIGRLFINQL